MDVGEVLKSLLSLKLSHRLHSKLVWSVFIAFATVSTAAARTKMFPHLLTIQDEHKHIQGLQCAPCLCKSHVWSAALDVWSSEDPYINEFLQCYLGLTSTKD